MKSENLGSGLVLGMVIGIVIGTRLDNVAMGIAIGIVGGVSVTAIISAITSIMRDLRASDELQKKVQSNAIMFSAITTGVITFGYGILESIGFPKFPLILILPMMFFIWGIGLVYFWRKYQ